MAPPVITITRQYASGGSEVARLVAAELGWDVIDNEFVDEVARRAGLPPDAVAQREERAPGLLERLARTLAAGSPEMFIATAGVPRVEPDEAAIVQLTERVIAEAAAHGRIVLVGRGAQAVLAQRPDALHVYVVAAKPWRMKLAVERLGVNPAEVEKVVDETDRQRDQYVRTYYGRHRQDVVNYDLVVNTEKLGLERSAALAACLSLACWHGPTPAPLEPVAVVPFDAYGGAIYVPAVINGDSAWLMFDTGLSRTGLDRDWARTMGIVPGPEPGEQH